MDLLELKKISDGCEIVDNKLVVSSELERTLRFIKENYHFDVLKDIKAVDLKEQGIELIYYLYNTEDDENLCVSLNVINEAESVSSLFDSAVADEKEIYDLFGVKFIGNEELKRLYMPEGWEGHPLKKDYEEKDERLNWND